MGETSNKQSQVPTAGIQLRLVSRGRLAMIKHYHGCRSGSMPIAEGNITKYYNYYKYYKYYNDGLEIKAPVLEKNRSNITEKQEEEEEEVLQNDCGFPISR